MDVNVITTAISTIGFPIVACMVMAWYVKYTEDKHDQREQELTACIERNTEALKELTMKVGD